MKRTILNIMLCLSLIVVSGALIDSQVVKVNQSNDSIIQPLDLPWEW